jgi:peptidyl-tRNA hydrolase, PTH1 family
LKLIAGLGNPGPKFRGTRHNIGFDVLDELARRANVAFESAPADALVARWRASDVLLVKPLTFMNRSGLAVEALRAARGLAPTDVLAVVDDVALELGELRVRERGSHGGHNGLRSLIDVMGTEDFPRVRVGIKKGELPEDLAEYVLSEFPEEDVLVVQEIVGRAADAVESFLREGPAPAMNRFNGPQKG